MLRMQISSALQGALLVQQEEKRARQLQTVAEVSTATSTNLDALILLQQVVDLTKERFSLYHAHIYLLNDAGDTLDLVAGAGEKGRKMVTEGWQIPLNQEQSLVARAAQNRQGEIVNDVRANPYWLSNPLLPDTRSEMAIPLMVGEQILGVLDVQASEVDYFTEEDMHIQSTLAAQIAVAIKNAQLYHEEAQRVQQLGKLNADLEAAQTELLRQERLATLGRLTATVSHEIRNPLATIRASAFSIDRKIRDKGLNVEPALDRIQRNITRCDNIISELLDYTRMGTSKLQPILFDDWLKTVLDEQAIPKGITLKLNFSSNTEILLDPERFRRVIINLVDNAYQSMLEYNTSGDNPPVLSIKSEVVNQQLQLYIADTGPGIPPDVMPHIFEPLYSTKGFGVGLGLSIVKEIIKQHAGEIEITSKIGQGTQVTLWLPLPQ
jgi:signal transduction histidine kinase